MDAKSDLRCSNAYCRHQDDGVCVIRVPYYPGEEIDHCTYFEHVVEPVLYPASDRDIDVLDVIHEKIMKYATKWATGTDECIRFIDRDLACGMLLAWREVAKALGLKPARVLDMVREYQAMLGLVVEV